MPMTPAAFAAAFDVSRETQARLEAFDACLLAASARHNLVARSTLGERWDRHFSDSAQLFRLVPAPARSLVDLGSGAGFPGLVLAAMGAGRGLDVTLVESVGKKAAFLADAVAAMGLDNARVIPARIETLNLKPPDVITARALASLPALLGHAFRLSGGKALCIFPKGQDVAAELTEAAKCWHMRLEQRASVTHPQSSILLIDQLRPKRPGP